MWCAELQRTYNLHEVGVSDLKKKRDGEEVALEIEN